MDLYIVLTYTQVINEKPLFNIVNNGIWKVNVLICKYGKVNMYKDHSLIINIIWYITSGIIIATLTFISFIIATN